MSGLLKDEGVQQMEERTLGGESGTAQDVTIILIPKGGTITDQKLALIHLHSHVLSSHSNYFKTCLSERWKSPVSPSPPLEFTLEVQTEVQHYFDCFSNMYSPFVKSFESVKHGVQLLKVASQIDFPGLMERISLYLSCMLWTKEEEIRIREYSASPDFPRIHLKDLVARLGLDEMQEDREKQLFALIRQCIRSGLKAASDPAVLTLPTFLKTIGCTPPSDYSRRVFAVVSQEAKDMFINIDKDWHGKIPGKSNTAYIETTIERIQTMCWILEALLRGQVAEELVQAIVHLDTIPTYVSNIIESRSLLAQERFAKVVLVMYKEVIAGRLLLKPPERMALLANCHELLKSSLTLGTFEQATADLFLTLPLKQQTELIDSGNKSVTSSAVTSSLASMLQFQRTWAVRESNSTVFKFETIEPLSEESEEELSWSIRKLKFLPRCSTIVQT